MSDYMFMLDSHLNGDQSKVLAEVREAAEQANLNLFLTGGAMRDMMGGIPSAIWISQLRAVPSSLPKRWHTRRRRK